MKFIDKPQLSAAKSLFSLTPRGAAGATEVHEPPIRRDGGLKDGRHGRVSSGVGHRRVADEILHFKEADQREA